MKDYADFYRHLTAPLHQRPWSLRLLRGANWILTKIMALFYGLLLAFLIWQGCLVSLSLTVGLPALAFLLLSFFRTRLNRPRPYETWSIDPLISKSTKGNSFPSRHVFSASMISLCLWQVSWILALICLTLSALLAFCRVLGGLHYPKDVLWGYILGLGVGLFLLIFL